MDGVCPRCGCAIGLAEGKPVVTWGGSIELWHASCWATRHARPVEVVTVIAPRLGPSRRAVAAGAAALVVGALAVVSLARGKVATASVVALDPFEREDVPLAERAAAREEPPPARTPDERFPVPYVAGEPLDEQFPSLREWAHPVSDAAELVPEQPSRQFGAAREGLEVIRPECGEGHCGIDLDGPRGQPVVAVADGTVVRVERHERGLDGRSGRYVRIEHEDGTLTAYMHLDDIADGLDVGAHVEAGQMIGTLGATAVYASAPHLHFSLEIPRHPGERHGDHTDTYYVDPAPFLARATVVPRPPKPAL
ncbi:MAG: M23 family metallopeptidase [Acidobacteriota bacterium]